MRVIETLRTFMTPLDGMALLVFLVSVFGYGSFISSSLAAKRSNLVGAIQLQRLQWMLNMSRRHERAVDVILMNSLGQGNAFFASTTAIAIGGVAALLGSGERAQVILEKLPLVAHTGSVLWECKLLLIMTIFVFAFFKFAWAFRLSHYATIMIGATPNLTDSNQGDCEAHATRTAGLIGLAADHANSGLRSFYYAFAALAWFVHPIAFLIATLWVLIILIRRDYFSRSRRLIASS